VARYFHDYVDGPPTIGEEGAIGNIDPHQGSEASIPIRNISLFDSVDEGLAERFLAGAKPVSFRARERLIDTNARDSDVYLLSRGFAEVRRARNGGSVAVATLGPGDLIGEMSMLLGSGRTADVVALTEGEYYRIAQTAFQHGNAAADDATLSRINFNLAAILARRLQATTSLVA